MQAFTRAFGQGLLVIAPIAITVFVVYKVVTLLDGWLKSPIPGLGVVVTAIAIAIVGALTKNVLGRRIVKLFERLMNRLPIVKLLYSSLRDLFGAFVGEKKTFDRPVVVDLYAGQGKVLGFITCEHFDDPQLADHVSVYLPQSYNFAGNMIVVPRSRVRPLDADGAEFMAFIMSGGVTEMNAAKTMLQAPEGMLR